MYFKCIGNISISAILILLATSCKQSEPIAILKGYEPVFTSDQARLYQYTRLPQRDTLFILFTRDKGHRITESGYTKSHRIYDRVFLVTPNTKEETSVRYFFYSDTLRNSTHHVIDGTVSSHVVKQEARKFDDSQYGIHLEYPNQDVFDISIYDSYDTDTIYSWRGKMLPALKFIETSDMVGYDKYLESTLVREEKRSRAIVIFAQDVGLVFFRQRGDIFTELRLVDVEVFSDSSLATHHGLPHFRE